MSSPRHQARTRATASVRAAVVDGMIRWKQKFNELAPNPDADEREMLRERLCEFMHDLMAACDADREPVDVATLDELLTEIERI